MENFVLPLSLEQLNVLLVVTSEVFILTLGSILTKKLYAILTKRRLHRGKTVELHRRKWTKTIPFAEDLHFNDSWEKILCTFIRLVLLSLTILASFEIGNIRTYDILGTSEYKLSICTEYTSDSEIRSFWNARTPLVAKHGCEVVNATHITYKASLFSQTSSQFSCGEGQFSKEVEIMVLRWRLNSLPIGTELIPVRHSNFNYTTRTFIRSNVPRINTSEESEDFIEFRKLDNREFLLTVKGGARTVLELIKPRFKDMVIYGANQINHDRANNNARQMSVARSFSNHAVWAELKEKEMTGEYLKERATLSKRGLYYLIAGIAIVGIVLPLTIAVLRMKTAYIKIDPTDAIGVASLCLVEERRACSESMNVVRFAITDRGDSQHLGLLPTGSYPSRRDKTRPLTGEPDHFEGMDISYDGKDQHQRLPMIGAFRRLYLRLLGNK